jgi:predicted membrane-bound spermidine synthase
MSWGAKLKNYFGLFAVALSTLMYEILLTRIYSIALLYHFAFMAISVGMLGMTVGAVIVYLMPSLFDVRKAPNLLAIVSWLFGLSIAATFYCYTKLPAVVNMTPEHIPKNYPMIIGLLVIFCLSAVPFVFSGISICIALTKLPQPINKLYAADLIGASSGCLFLLFLLNYLDGVSAMFFIAGLACSGALFFAIDNTSKKVMLAIMASIIGLFLFTGINNFSTIKNHALVKVPENDLLPKDERLYEKWNSFSRILVHGDKNTLRRPTAWGLSQTWPENKKVSELILNIDSNAYTPLTQFSGDFNKVEYLQHDVINAAHIIRKNANIFIVGVGGGRDILSALFFKDKHICGAEINNCTIDALVHCFGDYTGHLDQYPTVKIVNDEARSCLTRSKDKFDIIQISLVDTFAATVSGAFVFTENALYTTEAWKIIMDHLTPNGVLSLSYWYSKDRGIEIYRFLSLAVSTLKQLGIEDCRKHVIVLTTAANGIGITNIDVATILVSKQPFSEEDLSKLEIFAKENKFNINLSPKIALDELCAKITSAKDLNKIIDSTPFNISPPTDDTPFFFHMVKPKDSLSLRALQYVGREFKAIPILQCLLVLILVLSLYFIFGPLLLGGDRSHLKNAFPLLLYFGSIGMGFMFIEISQMQRLIVFLGHPTYGLSTVLFTLLLSGGIGSYFVSTVSNKSNFWNRPTIRLGALLIILVLFGCLTALLIPSFRDYSTPMRIAISVLIIFPIGFFMGMPFPIGIMLTKDSFQTLTPWLWGVNGTTSVLASVLALAVALMFGLSVTFWIGVAFYFLAFVVYSLAASKLSSA